MTVHIGAKPGQIAETVLMPGDPYRAKWAAQTFLEGAELVNEVRGMLGFTGTYKGNRVTIQGSGMGMPSLSIYANELIRDYNAQTLIRIGSCGGMQPHVGIRDVIVGGIYSSDVFYAERPDLDEQMVRHGILGVEMEAAELYTLAARHGRRALAVLTVSDHLQTGEALPSEDREKTFGDMVEIALEAAFA